jgi:hypothetical protein
LIYPLEKLKEKGYDVAGFFYNPNIHSFSEYISRRKAVEGYNNLEKIEIIYPEYDPREFFNAVNQKEQVPERCFICWELRLNKTAQKAKKEGFDSFSTTLLVSPYQDQYKLQEIGNRISEREKINFYFEDFRPGFRKAHDEAKAKGIYCQKYCGCVYSEIERHSGSRPQASGSKLKTPNTKH